MSRPSLQVSAKDIKSFRLPVLHDQYFDLRVDEFRASLKSYGLLSKLFGCFPASRFGFKQSQIVQRD